MHDILRQLRQLLRDHHGVRSSVHECRARCGVLRDTRGTAHIASVSLMDDGRLRIRFNCFEVVTSIQHLQDVAAVIARRSPINFPHRFDSVFMASAQLDIFG
jgi:Cft2 family RNA processing exonuclease